MNKMLFLFYMHSTQTDTWTSTYTWLYTSAACHTERHNSLLLYVQSWNPERRQEARRFTKPNWRHFKFHFSALELWCRLNHQPTVPTDFGSFEEASPPQPVPSARQPRRRLPRGGPYPGPSPAAPSSPAAGRSPAQQGSQRGKDNSDWFCLLTGQ